MLWDASDHEKPLGTQADEAHHGGEYDFWLGYSHSTAQQHVTGKDPNSGKTNNAGKSQALCFNTVVMFRLRRMDYSFFFFPV